MLPSLWILMGSLVLAGCRPNSRDISKGVDWLARYGYLPAPDPYSAQQRTKEGLQEAVRTMQRFAGLRETGELDDETIRMMQKPRCSLPDIILRPEFMGRRRKRYVLSGSVWPKKKLTWRVDSFPVSLTQDLTRALLSRALFVWGQETQLSFSETSGEADLRVGFVDGSHGDGYPFDGPGGTLGHAFYPGGPSSGDTHMDADESWTYNDDKGTDLFAVAVHEFGHSLGLSHSSAENSIMMPYYQGTVGDPGRYRLPPDDVMGIQTLYGKKVSSPEAKPPHPIPTHYIPPRGPTYQPRLPFPDRCTTHFDAIANIRGEVFFFKNRFFWRVQSTRQLVSLAPAHLHRFWLGLPSDLPKVDAVYERINDSKIIFISGSRYWVFKDTLVEPGYPRALTDFGLNTDSIDGAFVWPGNKKTYFFRNNQFWRLDEKTGRPDSGYPKNGELWKGVPPNVDDVISWTNDTTYFFKASQYWKFRKGSFDAEPGYPRSTALNWMYCPMESPNTPTYAPEGRGQRDCICKCNVENSATQNDAALSKWLILHLLLHILWRLS
ncbi:matrix metalloproteinase-25 [Bombina bombina]|uniref:matrix metalloproteinase-25 n=1 Tax=Bombina bombina TaxID=8345 RepID=UPI00235B1548|nr:matrix metalloproteinase-25 [Bombina bombina]